MCVDFNEALVLRARNSIVYNFSVCFFFFVGNMDLKIESRRNDFICRFWNVNAHNTNEYARVSAKSAQAVLVWRFISVSSMRNKFTIFISKNENNNI